MQQNQIIKGVIIGLVITIILQHFLFGNTDMDYNIFYQLKRLW